MTRFKNSQRPFSNLGYLDDKGRDDFFSGDKFSESYHADFNEKQAQRISKTRGGVYFVIGCDPTVNSVLDHSNRSKDLIKAVRYLMSLHLDEIVIADEPLILNMLKNRTFPQAVFYEMYGATPLDVAGAEAKVIGIRERLLIEAIQKHLILSDQAKKEDYKSVVLMSEDFPRHEIKRIFSRLFSLTEPDPFRASFGIYDRDEEEPFELRDPAFASKVWEALPYGIRTTDFFLKERGQLPYDQLSEQDIDHARNLMAYALFQVAYVLYKGGVKHGFPKGEIKLDQLTQYCLRYAPSLGLDEISSTLKFAYPDLKKNPELAKVSMPYRAARFGSPVNFEVLAMGGYGKIKSLEAHLERCMSDYFPIFEGLLEKIKHDPSLETRSPEEFRQIEGVDYLKHMLGRLNDGSCCQEALEAAEIEMQFDPAYLDVPPRTPEEIKEIEAVLSKLRKKNPFGAFILTDPVENLKELVCREGAGLTQAVRQDLQRLEVMKLLKEILAALETIPELKEALEQSGIKGAIHEHYSISELSKNNRLDLKFEPLNAGQERRARISYLRNKIERLKIQERNYDYEEAEFGSLYRDLIQSQKQLFELLSLAKVDSSEFSTDFESPELYLIDGMERVLFAKIDLKSKHGLSLRDFFGRLKKALTV